VRLVPRFVRLVPRFVRLVPRFVRVLIPKPLSHNSFFPLNLEDGSIERSQPVDKSDSRHWSALTKHHLTI
jgi:hypothetical protein